MQTDTAIGTNITGKRLCRAVILKGERRNIRQGNYSLVLLYQENHAIVAWLDRG